MSRLRAHVAFSNEQFIFLYRAFVGVRPSSTAEGLSIDSRPRLLARSDPSYNGVISSVHEQSKRCALMLRDPRYGQQLKAAPKRRLATTDIRCLYYTTAKA